MAVKYKMDEDARDTLDRRILSGREALKTHDSYVSEEAETTARDLVSDILTTLFGPAGRNEIDRVEKTYEVVLDEERCTLARTFLDLAYESWEGDAEDYTATLVTVDNPLLGEEPKDEPTVADIKAKIIAEIDGFDAPEDERDREAWIENLDSETYGRYQAYLDVLALVNYDIRET